MIEKALYDRHRHEIHLSIMGVAFCLLISVVGVTLMNKKMVKDMELKTLQVNSLIEEVGELKEENIELNETMKEKEAKAQKLQSSLIELKKNTKISEMESLKKELDLRTVAFKSLLKEGTKEEEQKTSMASDQSLDILILGTHGRLTDTLMLASIQPKKRKVILISLPRDLAVDGRRINEYWYRFGIDEMRKKIEGMTGLYPEKYVVVDMKSFETLVDQIGGIDIQVEKDLYDAQYPGPNFGYEVFSISAGKHHLDGTTALKYARSRKSSNDFERAKRQQQIVDALKSKILSLDPQNSIEKWIGLYSAVAESIETDIDVWNAINYLKEYKEYEIEGGNVLSNTNHLYTTTGINGAYLLLPKGGNYENIKSWVQELIQK